VPPRQVIGQPYVVIDHTLVITEFKINTVIRNYFLDLHPYICLELSRYVNYIGSYDFFEFWLS
jgi:hypothetical protein